MNLPKLGVNHMHLSTKTRAYYNVDLGEDVVATLGSLLTASCDRSREKTCSLCLMNPQGPHK